MLWWKNVYDTLSGSKVRITIVVLLGLIVVRTTSAQRPSVLAAGNWYRLAVTQSGVYRLDAKWLRAMGMPVSALNPRYLQVYGNGGRMLPQSNAAPRPQDLVQNAIWVKGEEDNRFDDGDAIFFYAEGPHTIAYDSVQAAYTHSINTYSDTSYYYLTVGPAPGLRIAATASQAFGSQPVAEQFDDYWFHEKESVNLLQSGRQWWGEYLGLSGQLRLTADLPGLIPNSPARLRGSVIASAQVPTRLRWRINGQEVGEQTQGTVSTYRYDLKAQMSEKNYTFTLGPSPADELSIIADFDKNSQANAQAYLNYAALQVKRSLKAYKTQQLYRFLPGANTAIIYSIKDTPSDWQWWDVANPSGARQALLVRTNEGHAKFSTGDGRRARVYVGFSSQQAFEPQAWVRVTHQNLHALPTPELLIITAPAWKKEADRLAQFRRTHTGLITEVVTTEQVYNEYASGKVDPTALRDFVRELYRQSPTRLRYLLLLGDATYDYRNRSGSQSARQRAGWVPVYESRESLHPVFTYSSDDYFGFLEDHEGEWTESSAGDHTLDIGIGRLPVKSSEEARTVVNKLIHYDTSPKAYGKWRNRISFVADDGDGNIHQQHADRLAGQVDNAFLTQRLFVDAFPRITSPEGVKAPALNALIRQQINEGTLILNYTGHGGASGWAEEQILTLADMQNVRGYDNLPLLLTATCEFGRYDDPALVSGAELMVLSPRGGAVGALTTTRPVFASTNFSLNKAFYEALSEHPEANRLGDLMQLTKNHSLSGSLNRNFALLGDPSLQLARSTYQIRWAEQPDTLSALRKVTLRGAVYPLGKNTIEKSFNGMAQISVYDKPVRFRTRGEGGEASEYSELQNKLYEGQVTIQNGTFSCSFIVPRNMDYRQGAGRVSVYAIRSDSLADASGQLGIWTGGASQPTTDRTPPTLSAYINDPSFQDGQTVPENSVLWIKTYDESGISISKAGLGQELTATLNDTATFRLNDYYTASPDDFRHGLIRFPLSSIPAGAYRLRIKVWDANTNLSEQTLRFVVGEKKGIQLSSPILFPNPFREQLSFKIAHDRPQEDIEISFHIHNLSGQNVFTFSKVYYNSEPIIEEDLTFKLNSPILSTKMNVYLYNMRIRSIKDQTTDQRSGKLLHLP